MPALLLDGRSISFDPGATILEAARAAGVEFPTFCRYSGLFWPASCRLCLVSIKGQRKLAAACATPAAEGMEVETESSDAVANRRSVIQLLLDRYPGEHLTSGGRGSAERVRALGDPLRRHAAFCKNAPASHG
ncbi:MAG: 2Fe-2S iron-sulfur cluster-binding protein [Gemmatimonadales bacterium]